MKPRIERVTIPSGCSVRVYNRRIPDIPFEWHHHPEFELTLTLNSRGLRFIGDHVGNYESKDLVLIPSDMPHTWASNGAADQSRPHQAVVVWFTERWARQIAEVCREYAPVSDLLNRSGGALHFEIDAADRMLKHLPDLLSDSPITRLHAVTSVLVELANVEASPLATIVKPTGAKQADWPQINRVLNTLHKRYFEPIRVEDLCDVGNMSPRTLHRMFVGHVGENISDYLRKLRIGHACLLLVESDMSVSAIAREVGFPNLSNFNRAFLATKKMTPRDLRRFVRQHGQVPRMTDLNDAADSERSFILQRDRLRQIRA